MSGTGVTGDNDSRPRRVKPPRTDAEHQREAEQARKERERNRRDALSRVVSVLDDVAPDGRPRPRHLAAVASFYGVHPRAVQTVLRRHREEFDSDGWLETDPYQRYCDYWPDEAVVRAGLLVEKSVVADQLRHLLGERPLPLMYSLSDDRIDECMQLHRKALKLIGDVHDVSPDEVWHRLQQTERYELMALVVTLAALVDYDRPNPGKWLRELSTPTGKRKDGSVRRGLALLIPVRQSTDDRRVPRPGVALNAGSQMSSTAAAQ